MKKIIALLLAVLMVLAMFTACSKQEEASVTTESAAAETPAEDA